MLSKFMLLASWAFLLKFVCPSTLHCQDGYDDHRNHDGDHRYNHDSHDVWLASLFPPSTIEHGGMKTIRMRPLTMYVTSVLPKVSMHSVHLIPSLYIADPTLV